MVGILLVWPSAARAEVDGNALKVSLVTFGPGTHPFLKFGHNAILIDHEDGKGIIYNFGMFNFSSPALIPKFALGRSEYWLARTMRDDTLADYAADDRTVQVQELALTPAERKRLFERLEENARPQNRNYLYDYFYDNCSTRVRDALDAVLAGKLRAGAGAPARLTYRQHALRLVSDLPWEYVALDYALGLPADRAGTRWEESFIPMELRDVARSVRLPDGQPLVKAERLVYRSTRADPPQAPPRYVGRFAIIGVSVGLIFFGLGRLARRSGAARITLGTLASLVGFVAGLGGTLLLFLWVATNHRASHANANILQSVPWALALVPYGIKVARGRLVGIRRAGLLAAAAAGTAILGVLANLLGLLAQDNAHFAALFVPLWCGLTLGLRALRPRGPRVAASS